MDIFDQEKLCAKKAFIKWHTLMKMSLVSKSNAFGLTMAGNLLQ